MELTGDEIRLLLGLLCEKEHEQYHELARKLNTELDRQIDNDEDDYAGIAKAMKGLKNIPGGIQDQILDHLRRGPVMIDEGESDGTTVVKTPVKGEDKDG